LYWQSSVVSAEQTTLHRDDWYLSQPEKSATIQMSGHESEGGAIAFIDKLELSGDIGYYQTRYKNKPWFAVTYGLFDTLAEARSHLKTLSSDLQAKAPWPRTFKVIQSLIGVAGKQASSIPSEDDAAENEVSTTSTWEQGQAAYDIGDFNKAFDIWLELAKRGDELSQFNLGVLYSRGEGADLDRNKAIEWYVRSAEQGYAPAQFNLGAAYLEGDPDSADAQKAVTWWQLAAEQGFVQAQFNIASLYCRGIGISRDMDRCKFWYRRAASNGDMLARKMLDYIMETEKEGKSDIINEQSSNSEKLEISDENAELLVQPVSPSSSADKDGDLASVSQEAMDQEIKNKKLERKPEVRKLSSQEQVLLRKAQAAFTRNNYMKSHDIWLPLAESGIAEAQYSLGFLYQSGWGPERDIQKAVAWYSSAAEQNEARAQFNLGAILLNGEDNVEKDLETGVLWLTRSADSNNTRAKEFLINLYTTGKYGIKVSKEKADYWKSR